MSSKWTISATEIQTFTTCRRKWAFTYLEEIKPAPSKAAAFGQSVHQLLQNYLIGNPVNFDDPTGQVSLPGLTYLPKNLPRQNVERPFAFIRQGHIFTGIIDFCKQLDHRTWLIGDHKTCSSFRTALTPNELKTNIQASIYAQWAFQELGAETVKLNWVYYRTKSKPEARLVECEIKSKEAPTNFEPQLAIADDIKRTAQKTTRADDLPKNLDACFKYGPCPFFARCRHGTEKTGANHQINIHRSNILNTQNQNNGKAFHLFVDCMPTKSEFSYERTIELSDLLKPVLAQIQTEKELPHYRLAGYGQHVGLISTYLSKHLHESAYDERTAILSSVKTPEGCDTLQTLSSAAGRVVRGF